MSSQFKSHSCRHWKSRKGKPCTIYRSINFKQPTWFRTGWVDFMPWLVSTPAALPTQLLFPCPGNWVLLAPVMYSKLHLQPTDKSALCCSWRMVVEMKIHHGMLLCQEEGHFWFFSACWQISAQGEHKMDLLSQIRVVKLLSIPELDWVNEMMFCCIAASPSCLNTQWGQTWCVNNIYIICWGRIAFLSTEW